MKAKTPPNERERLQVIHECKLLDTPPEEEFDRICRLAAEIFAAPIAAISLIDEDRQVSKVSLGSILGTRAGTSHSAPTRS